ncbi:hypothetical protein [Cytobacillus oceanisediminis]|nr:hypothetical protein [Cytobacillus oceanisediminis]
MSPKLELIRTVGEETEENESGIGAASRQNKGKTGGTLSDPVSPDGLQML